MKRMEYALLRKGFEERKRCFVGLFGVVEEFASFAHPQLPDCEVQLLGNMRFIDRWGQLLERIPPDITKVRLYNHQIQAGQDYNPYDIHTQNPAVIFRATMLNSLFFEQAILEKIKAYYFFKFIQLN